MKVEPPDLGQNTAVRTFLIADVRGYTHFTREHGDVEAARLATKFAYVARDCVEARGGRVIELRGDEALAIFTETAQAIRAATEFQVACAEETARDPALPLTVGIGIDVGEAIPVEDGFRGAPLNTAARLCSRAAAGQVLVTRAVAEQADNMDDVHVAEFGPIELKGFATVIDVIEVVSQQSELRVGSLDRARAEGGESASLPPELDLITPLVDREHEMHWLRGTWRQARRGRGRVVFVSGPSQIGKTRLAAELAREIGEGDGRVVYTGPGGAATALAIAAIREARDAVEPTLLILDDLDLAGEDAARILVEAQDRLRSRPVMTIGLIKSIDGEPILAGVVEEADRLGDGHMLLSALGLDGVGGIARLYLGADVEDVPLEAMARASGGVPGRVHEVVGEWARGEAARRLAAAAEWLAEGRGRRSADLDFANNIIGLKLGRLYSSDVEVTDDAACPYKGLASFEQADAAYFFGRERLVGELAARTVQFGLLGVVGASGSGKSSAVAAGLLPSLRAGLLPGSERWRTVMFRPGEHPLAELSAALAPDPPATADGRALVAAIDEVAPDGRLVVAIDQFEEVFTQCTDGNERDVFIEIVTQTALRRPEHVVFVLTIRDDFYGRCAPYRDLAELLSANHVLVPPMTIDALRRAIELPARRVRLHVESALVDALVGEAAEEPGALPLLSAALVELWQAREDGWLRLEAHQRMGGLRGAVARLAEASYQQLTDAEQEAARRIFRRLSGIGEGDLVTRRRVPISEFDLNTDQIAADVLARLTQDRLLTMSDSAVEVAHEALLREWPRLREWLEEDAQGHRLLLHLTQAAQQWASSGRDASEVYRGARLSTALDWASSRGTDLNELEREFLVASREASEREAEKQRRTNRRLRGLLMGTALFLSVAVIAGGLAVVQRGRAREETQRAEQEARLATARELAAAAVANLDVDPERSILLGLEAVDATWKVDGTVVASAEEALHRALKRSRVVLTVLESGGLAVSPDGSRFATSNPEGVTTVRDMETGEAITILGGHKGAVTGIAFSPDGSIVATTGQDRTARLWDATSGRQMHLLKGHNDVVLGPAFSPDGRLLATKGYDRSVRIWDVAAGRVDTVLRGPPDMPFEPFGTWSTAPFSPDGTRVVSGGWGTSAIIWDLATGDITDVLTGPRWEMTDVAFSPDGQRIVTVGYEGTTRTWDATSGRQVSTFSGPAGELTAVDYSPDGKRIATAGTDGTAVVWDAATGEQLMTLTGHSKGIANLVFTPDGDRLLTAGLDGTTRIWDVSLEGGRDWLTVPGPALRMGGVAFSPDGSMLAVPNQVTGVTIRDTDTGAKIASLKGHDGIIARMEFSPDGNLLAGTDGTGINPTDKANWKIPIWDVKTGQLVKTLVGHKDQVPASAFSSDGTRLVTASYDGMLRIWDVASGTEERSLDVGADAFGLGFSPDGRFLLAGVGLKGPVTVWDAETLKKIGTLRGHTDYIQTLSFSPDGRVATASGDGTAKIWDLATLRELTTLRGHSGGVLGVAFSPDGTGVATGSTDGTAKVWDAATGQELFTLFGHTRIIHTVAFSPDGRLLATASGDGTVAVHLLPIDELRELAQDRVTRSLTDAECRQYLHLDSCRTAF